MKFLIFDIIGKFGHFRKYYSNSSALSFCAPPRTTVCGMIAAILGMEKDTYYTAMDIDNCKIAVSCKTPLRKTIHKLNYLYIKSVNDLNGSNGNPTQVPFEIVSAPFIGKDDIQYRIFFSHKNEKIFYQLREKFLKHENQFALCLGAANFTAYYKFINMLESEMIDEDIAQISSLVPSDRIVDYMFEDNQGKNYVSEMLPLQFNDNRELISHKEIIYSDNGEPLYLKVKQPVHLIQYNNKQKDNIVIME